jgi:hypothetical protein
MRPPKIDFQSQLATLRQKLRSNDDPLGNWEVQSVNTIDETTTSPDNSATISTRFVVSITSVNTRTGETKTEPIPAPEGS